jgi:hypothetical protein
MTNGLFTAAPKYNRFVEEFPGGLRRERSNYDGVQEGISATSDLVYRLPIMDISSSFHSTCFLLTRLRNQLLPAVPDQP